MPAVEIGRGPFFVRRTGKNEIGHSQVADRTGQGGAGVFNLIAEPQRSFTDFIGRTRVAEDGGIHFILVDHHRIVADFRHIRPLAAHHESGQHDGWVCLRNEKTPSLQFGDLAPEFLDALFELRFALGLGFRFFHLGARVGDALLRAREERIGPVACLAPTVTCLRLEELPRAVDLHIAVAIGAIDVHIHIALHEEGAAARFRVAEFQDGVAVVIIVARENLVDFLQALFDPIELQVIKPGKIRRDLRRRQKLRQRREQLRQARIGNFHILKTGRRARRADLEIQLNSVGAVLLAIACRGLSGRSLNLPFVLQPVENHPGVHRFARDEWCGCGRRLRSRRGRGRNCWRRRRRGCRHRGGRRLAGGEEEQR